jgi:hypothetical protein
VLEVLREGFDRIEKVLVVGVFITFNEPDNALALFGVQRFDQALGRECGDFFLNRLSAAHGKVFASAGEKTKAKKTEVQNALDFELLSGA